MYSDCGSKLLVYVKTSGTPVKQMLFLAIILLTCTTNGLYAQVPQFTASLYQTSVNETAVDQGHPRPPDGFLRVSCNGSMNTSYSISTTDPLPFVINSSTGDLSVTEDLDYDTGITSYSFFVVCYERDSQDLNDTATVEIALLPVNEFVPEAIGMTALFVSVPEDTPVGTVIVSNSGTAPPGTLSEYTITDRDAGIDGVLTFTTTDLDTEFFRLEIDTGSVVLIRELDLDNQTDPAPNIFDPATITGCDFFPPIDTCPTVNIRIFVSQVNEFTPQFSQDSYSTSIPENTPQGTEVLVVECSDGDIGVGQFAGIEFLHASQSVMDAFTIDDSTGNVTARAVNYESDERYELTVRCVDTGGLEDFAEVTINIQDVNEGPPVCEQPSNISTTLSVGTYNYTSLFTLRCTDQDTGTNGVLLYKIAQIKPNTSSFVINIDDATGEVGYQGMLETTGIYQYEITIVVSDAGTIPLSVSVEVLVTIEAIPSCCYSNDLELTLPVGTHNLFSLLNLSCTGNEQLFYSIEQNNLGNFEIDEATGELVFSGTPGYDLTIRVSDSSDLFVELKIITVTITSNSNINQTGTSEQESSNSTSLILIILLVTSLLTIAILSVVLLAVWFHFRRRYNGIISDTVATGGRVFPLQQSSHFNGEMKECPAYVVSNRHEDTIADNDDMPHMYESIPGLSPPQTQQSLLVPGHTGMDPSLPETQQSIP